jgi:hypothetical protein
MRGCGFLCQLPVAPVFPEQCEGSVEPGHPGGRVLTALDAEPRELLGP